MFINTKLLKKKLLLEQVILKYHPDFKNRGLKKYALSHPQAFDITSLIEETMAHVGPYDFIDGEHCDFSDGTDCKTGSIRVNPTIKTRSCSSYAVEISGVSTPGGNFKTGGLRCVITNPHLMNVKYYMFPKNSWKHMANIHPSSNVGRIFGTYYSPLDRIKKFDMYKVSDFETLCNLPDK